MKKAYLIAIVGCFLIVILQWSLLHTAFIIWYPQTLRGVMLNRYTVYMVFWTAMGILLSAVFVVSAASAGSIAAWILGLLSIALSVHFCYKAAHHCYKKWMFIEYKHSFH